MTRTRRWIRELWASPAESPPRQRVALLIVALAVPPVVAACLVPLRVTWYGAPFGAIMATVVMLVAISGNRLAGVLAGISAAASYDYFLARPFGTFLITGRTDVVATVLLLLVGLLVATRVGVMRARVAARSRQAAQLEAANWTLRQLAARIEVMLEAAPEAMLSVDPVGRIQSANSQAGKLFGYPRADLIGQPVEALLPESLRAVHAARRAGYHAHPGPQCRSASGDPEGLRRDGTPFPAAVSLAPIELDGQPHVLAAVRDLTELRRTEQSLVRLATAVQQAGAAVLTRDADGIVTSWNEGAERMFGYPAAEIVGQPASILLPPDRAADLAEFQLVVKQQHTLHQETVRRRKDGAYVDVSASISPAPGAHGGIEVLTVMQDISERKRAETALAERTRELESANRELTEFAYIASHDLREPLRKISSFCQLLAEHCQGRLDAEADEYIAFAVDGAERMQQLIDGVLAFSRATHRDGTVREVDCGLLIKQVIADLSALIGEAGAQVTVSGALPVVRADPVPLAQVFQNLIGNAVKFHGPAPPRVVVSAARDGAAWRFAVADNGIGIDPAYVGQVFTIFRRLHTREEYPGTGIGLAICKKVVESYGGRIWLDSGPAGTTFYWTMPDEAAA